MQAIQIYVEGIADKRFVEDLIEYLHHPKKDTIGVIEVGGKDGLRKDTVQRVIREVVFKEGKNYVIFDANGDINTRKVQIRNDLVGIDPSCEIFLLPNNNQPGNLEKLLSDLILADHRQIFGCFEQFQGCIKQLNKGYKIPDLKAKIFSYLDILDSAPKEKDRVYLNPSHWNMDAPALDPLKAFLVTI